MEEPKILRDLKKGDKIKVKIEGTTRELEDAILIFDHLDGMYSYCYLERDPKKVAHPRFDTPLQREGDHYIIAPIK